MLHLYKQENIDTWGYSCACTGIGDSEPEAPLPLCGAVEQAPTYYINSAESRHPCAACSLVAHTEGLPRVSIISRHITSHSCFIRVYDHGTNECRSCWYQDGMIPVWGPAEPFPP